MIQNVSYRFSVIFRVEIESSSCLLTQNFLFHCYVVVFPMLNGLRRAGKKVFLLTNSLFDYTQVVMNYMYQYFLRDQHLTPETRKDIKEGTWMDYFDVIIAGGNKPAFLLDEG